MAQCRSIRCAGAAEQDRPAGAVSHGPVDRSPDSGRQRDEDDLAALAVDPQDPVAVFLAEVVDVGAGGFEDPQAEQSEHRDQGEVVDGWPSRGRRSGALRTAGG